MLPERESRGTHLRLLLVGQSGLARWVTKMAALAAKSGRRGHCSEEDTQHVRDIVEIAQRGHTMPMSQ